MSMDFTESLTIELPHLGEDYTHHMESVSESGLIVEIAAIHEGVTANYNYYSGEELEKSFGTWTAPYPKPVITNHDQWSEALGRVMQARIAKENDLTTIMLQAAIGDKNAVEKFNDKRFLTGSVGGKAKAAICNICDTDWAQPPKEGSYLPCTHKRGQAYKGKIAVLEMRGIDWKEYSMVNTPADASSGVRQIDPKDDGEEWVKAQLFSVNMNKESIIQFGESGSMDILVGKKRKEVVPLYHNIRGAFLSAFVAEDDSEVDKETEVSKPEENDDDILKVTEGLSDALANEDDSQDNTDETPAADDAEGSADDVVDETPSEGDADDDTADDSTDEGDAPVDDAADDSADEGDKPSDAADNTDEGDAPSDEDNTEEPSDESTDSDEGDSDEADAAAELDKSAQERITALEADITALKDENGKLRAALKKGLAERVVDLKIGLGHESADDRASLIEEHVSRSASSLADTLVDLSKTAAKGSVEESAELFSGKSGNTGVKGDTKVTNVVTEAEDRKVTPSDKLEDIVVAGLLGKRQL